MKRLEKVQKGDWILCKNEKGFLAYVPVEKKKSVTARYQKAVLDNGEVVITGEDQRFFIKGMIPRRARLLQYGDQLEVFVRTQLSQGYIEFSTPDRKFKQKQHILIMESVLERIIEHPQEEVHHKDENKENNVLHNLEVRTAGSHRSKHATGPRNPSYHVRNRRKWRDAISKGNQKVKHKTPLSVILRLGQTFEQKFGIELTKRNWDAMRTKHRLHTPTANSVANEYRFGSFQAFKDQCVRNHRVYSVTNSKRMCKLVTLSITGRLPFYLDNRLLVGSY